MVVGASLESGETAQPTVVEEFKPGVEPALTLHQLTEEQTARETPWKRELVTLTPVQVIDLMAFEYYYYFCTGSNIIFLYKVITDRSTKTKKIRKVKMQK